MPKITTAYLRAEIKKIVKNNPEVFDPDCEKAFPVEPGHVLHQDYKIRLNKPWKRICKCRLKNSDYLSSEDIQDIIDNGFWEFGYLNEEYLKNNNVNLDDCWLRDFVEPVEDHYSVTFITDPKDEIIILYSVNMD